MKQAAVLGTRQAALVEVPDLAPVDIWGVVKVHAAPMCAEYKGFAAGTPSTVLGHEAALDCSGTIQAAFELSASHATAKIMLHPWE